MPDPLYELFSQQDTIKDCSEGLPVQIVSDEVTFVSLIALTSDDAPVRLPHIRSMLTKGTATSLSASRAPGSRSPCWWPRKQPRAAA